MNTLKEFVTSNAVDTVDVSYEQIRDAEKILSFNFDTAYLTYLEICGQLEYEYLEFYGLGVPLSSHINVVRAYQELSTKNTYPKSTIPILDLGDGHYALYNIEDKKVIEWCADGIVTVLADNLESYMLDTLKKI
ncbi:SMI1/KNR4 family protein [Acinetobacter haemolyticus]|uniref:SMI1/KNR4 family protein n=1 Tax=Acinetobacter haemolyticus TaxID=29430 RepID=UPI000C2C7F91|nr:SMI1/KNR4 family protein [Acinetobacter haemolyticus]ATZ66798.1 hypothetical protein BSR56_05145 [Acinetobacter haemolyticus]